MNESIDGTTNNSNSNIKTHLLVRQESNVSLVMILLLFYMLYFVSRISHSKAFGNYNYQRFFHRKESWSVLHHQMISSASHRSDTSAKDTDQIINVLCLHGKGNNGETFQNILSPLEKKLHSQGTAMNLKFHFDYLDAPFVMTNDPSEKKKEWWRLPPGVRSFHAKEYQGFDISKSLVWNAVQNKKYDLVLGHSQGAILLSALITSNDWKTDIKGYIFNGAAWPNPFEDQMNEFQKRENDMTSFLNQSKFLFIIGDADTINPPESAMQVRKVFETIKSGLSHNVDTIHHSGGHAVPVKDEIALQSITDWIFGVALNQ